MISAIDRVSRRNTWRCQCCAGTCETFQPYEVLPSDESGEHRFQAAWVQTCSHCLVTWKKNCPADAAKALIRPQTFAYKPRHQA